MSLSDGKFGGPWTELKLIHLRKYLEAYAKVMKNQKFRTAYIDAFAGSGYWETKGDDTCLELPFPENSAPKAQRQQEGSARIALQVEPKFDRYFFVEKHATQAKKLSQLKADFPELAGRIEVVQEDANEYLKTLCSTTPWKSNRAVLFLDPYGMQVRWDTISAIAATESIDMWYLFPLGQAVNRLLRIDGKIKDAERQALDDIFGTGDWYDAFYTAANLPLFDEEPRLTKQARFGDISRFFVNRLKSVFTGVADYPRLLFNTRNNPLYLLCFACGNPKGAKIALRIAEHLLKKA